MPLTMVELISETNKVVKETNLYEEIHSIFEENPRAEIIIGGAMVVNRRIPK